MTRRPGGRGRWLPLPLCILLYAVPAAAQVPPPPPRDTPPAVPADTMPAVEPAAPVEVLAAVRFPAMPLSPAVGRAGAEWVWDREALLRETPTSLVDLLERIPGLATFRAGTFAQPEAASAYGGTAGRMEVEIDGFVLDPLAGSSFDLSQIPIGQIRELRVQRRLGLLRISILTEFPEQGVPYTRVEAGVGVPPANMFRGLFLVPHVIAGPLGLGIERLDTDGVRRTEPASVFSGWAKWSWTDGRRGAQFELLRATVRREPDSPWPTDRSRQDMVLRLRNELLPGLVAEAFVGRSRLDETEAAVAPEPAVQVDRSSTQAGIRAGLKRESIALHGSLRYRSETNLPRTEARIDGEVALGPLRAGAEAGVAAWEQTDGTSFLGARAELGPFLGAALFGEVTRGVRGAPAYHAEPAGVLHTDRNAWRAGASLDIGRAAGSVALVHLEQDVVVPFGLPFDRAAISSAPGVADGIEAHGRVTLWPRVFSLASWITDWRRSDGWTYLPARSWRTALELHTVPLASGNLEILGRAEAHMRGSTRVPSAAGEAGFETLPVFTTVDGYLHIRVIDVRIFLRWEDLLARDIEELPGRVYRGPRVFYGVKWNLWN